MASSSGRRKGVGRRKVEMKLIEKEAARRVSFSKRRTGLLKKANELSVLCGVDVAIVVFSPTGKLYYFGHPSVEAVIDRFTGRGDGPLRRADAATAAVPGYGREVMPLRGTVRELKQTKAELVKSIETVLGVGGVSLFDGRLDELTAVDLVSLSAGLEKMQADVLRRLELEKMQADVLRRDQLTDNPVLPATDMATNDSATPDVATAAEELSRVDCLRELRDGPIMSPLEGHYYFVDPEVLYQT